ncbi:MAG TPA: MFS transporter [Burkholderiales bacterium]|nr:MFS transporter [Burkholderiales bacterium]
MPHAFFFLASAAWNFGLGMTWLAVPLYAYSQGLSNAEIGALFAAPVLAQAPLNLAGGAYTDRIGGRRIMLASCAVVFAAGLWFAVAEGFWMLMVGQIALILSRAAFWPATWAMASELPGQRGIQLGRLNAITNFGQIGGTVLCGFLLAAAGYQATFLILAATGIVSLLAGLATTAKPRKAVPGRGHPMASYLPLLRKRIIIYTMLCAYLSALPFSLTMSFYPLLLAQFGHGEGESGVLLGLRAVGSIFASLLAARFVRTGPRTLWPVVCGLAVAASIGFVPLVNHALPIAFWMFVVGAGTAAMTLYFQITISEASTAEERGSALALGGLGWSVSHLSTPLLMGFLADHYGIVTGFYVLGGFALGGALMIAGARTWAFGRA